MSVESGIGWLPFMLEAADYSWLGAFRPGRERHAGDVLPSDLFRQSVYVTYWFESVAPKHFLDQIPIDNVLFETDFPHTTCLFGNIQETIEAGLGHVDETDVGARSSGRTRPPSTPSRSRRRRGGAKPWAASADDSVGASVGTSP